MTARKDLKKGTNKWKKLFYSLLGFNVVMLIILAFLLFGPVPETNIAPTTKHDTEDSSEFVVRTTKQNLNELVNAYIEKLLEGSNHHYSISLEEDVHLMGELPVFSTTVPLSVHLEPLVLENGDIKLIQRSISIGLLELPNQKIMEYMDKYLNMPEWVTINPKEEEIYVAVTEMEMKSNFKVSVEHIDLEANNLAFRIEIPYRTLGIDTVQ
ncbi:YpmS family protein [Oceanobacillus halophilus]|uniref:DUF2140 family protein n=1 Tax=Oceanobacillus halophilus TaxID=930130 RepID=A0A494ZXM1_9BACI|nr:YpmS family protein [Oceanobacillus halophilus]RKQ31493.1 DUF2140 family protein [Oceanobacillus halophilus]